MTTNVDHFPLPAEAVVMEITPEMAAHWLETRNTKDADRAERTKRQRNLSPSVARRYAVLMNAGRWLTTHQGIAFSTTGRLIDGQHRLLAIVLAGVPVTMLVTPNCDPETFAVLDNGFKRQAAHMLDVPHASVVASAARYLAVIQGGDELPPTAVQGAVYASTLATEYVVEIVEEWPELAAWSAAAVSCVRGSYVNAPTHLAVIAQAARTQYAEKLEEWVEGVTTGVELAATDPRLHLRNRFGRDYRILANTRGHAYNLIVKCWNTYALERPMSVLKVMDTEGVLTLVR